ncbi:hypothetical protein AAHC03_010176 [Spirometra sp. Aus1]
MLAISVTDAVSLVATLPTGLVRCAGHLESCSHPTFRDFRFAMSYYNNYFGFGLANVAEAASAWLTMLVSIERYMAMKHPTIANVYCRQQSGKQHVLTVALIAVAFNSPFFFTMRLSQRVVATNTNLTVVNRTVLVSRLTKFGDSVYYEIYTWIRFMCVQVFPLISLCIFNTLLLNVVSESITRMRQGQSFSSDSNNGHKYRVCKNGSPAHRRPHHHFRLRRTGQSSLSDSPTCGEKFVDCEVTKSQRSTRQKQLDRRQRAQTKLTIMQICIIFLFLLGQIPQAFSFEKISNVILPADCGRCCKLKNYYRLCSQVLSLVSYSLPFVIYVSLNKRFVEVLFSGFRWKYNDRNEQTCRSNVG